MDYTVEVTNIFKRLDQIVSEELWMKVRDVQVHDVCDEGS